MPGIVLTIPGVVGVLGGGQAKTCVGAPLPSEGPQTPFRGAPRQGLQKVGTEAPAIANGRIGVTQIDESCFSEGDG